MKKLLMAATLVVATNVAVAEDFGFYITVVQNRL